MDPEDLDYPDHSKYNHFILLPFQTYPEILSKSVHKFLSYLVHKQTEGQTDKARQKHNGNLLGGGN